MKTLDRGISTSGEEMAAVWSVRKSSQHDLRAPDVYHCIEGENIQTVSVARIATIVNEQRLINTEDNNFS